MSDVVKLRREMRQKRDAIIRKAPIALLDIGSSKIAAMIIQYIPSKDIERPAPSFRVLSSMEMASHGVRYGEVTSISHLQADLMRVLQNAQRASAVKVDYAVACFSGGRPQSYGAAGECSVSNGEVTEIDIGASMASCELPFIAPEREFMHAMPINFTLDHRSGLHDPRGQVGARLAVDMHMLSIDSAPLHSLHQAVRAIDMELIGATMSPFMSGLAVLTEDEQELGSVVIDMGAMTSTVAVFLRKQLLFVKCVRIGGHHVTNDIAQALGIDFQSAERMKTMHGGVEPTAADDRQVIEVAQEEGDGYGERNYINRAELIGIIRPRLEEIFEELADVLAEAGVDTLPSQRVVITGGASQITGLDGLAERYLGQRIRIGRTLRLPGAATHQTGPNFAAISGLALHTAMPRDEIWDFEDPTERKNSFDIKGVFKWFRQNW